MKYIDANELIDYCKHYIDIYKKNDDPISQARCNELLSVIGQIVMMPAVNDEV